MLTKLQIQNFALIEHLNLHFDSGYTTITGETGSGKSILLNALNLILGERADYNVIGNASDKSIVEAEFNIANYELSDFFEENDIDYYAETIIRREISKQGRSRSFINDIPVSLNVLKALTERLIRINSQHHTLDLRLPRFQLDLVDIMAGVKKERANFEKEYLVFKKLKNTIETIERKLNEKIQIADYNSFQLKEIQELSLDQIVYADLEQELKVLEHSEALKISLFNLSDGVLGEGHILNALKQIQLSLEKHKGIDLKVDDFASRLKGVLIELDDLAKESSTYQEELEMDPQKMQILVEKVDEFNRVLRKHHVVNQEQLKDIQTNLSGSEKDLDKLRADLIEKQRELDVIEKELWKQCDSFHLLRTNTLPSLKKEVESMLKELKIPDAKIDFLVEKNTIFNETGATTIELLFAANAGTSPMSVDKVASGGELARLMLTLQSLISSKIQLPTILFDEIDTGVSGEVAQKVGALLKKMGANMQLFAITHLPQVAGKAMHHLQVSKMKEGTQTKTIVTALAENERVEEIARLMSGESINEGALINAKALMNE
jgi:DNA repair protein RecN (Recombination protein N)